MGFFARRRARESAISEGAVEALHGGENARRSALFDSPVAADPEPDEEAHPSTADLGTVGKLIRSALEQGNVTVLAGEEVLDLGPAGLRGHAFEPLKLPDPDDGSSSPDSA